MIFRSSVFVSAGLGVDNGVLVAVLGAEVESVEVKEFKCKGAGSGGEDG